MNLVRAIASRFPEVLPHLTGRARFAAAQPVEYKTYDYFVQQVERLVRTVYEGYITTEFIDIMASLIQGQIQQAFITAWKDEGAEGPAPDYLDQAAEEMILEQYDFVDGFYADIVSARELEQPLEPLLARAPLWGNRYNDAYNAAVMLIVQQMGGKLVWHYGDTDHCDTCLRLNGIVAFAREWEALLVHPQDAPNDLLECGGWRCRCTLEPTDARRTRDAYGTIMGIVSK